MSEVQAILDRLVAQFASPYDFLRELVQNSMDAGSDRVEVSLEAHPSSSGDEVAFELSILDTGSGMDEAIIDGELTRLFASTKSDDRTMAGGYGIGFVSIFAWQPEAVLVQTGRAGEAWELVFYPDRRFDKRRLDEPFEGTTVTLFRRGLAHEGPAIAEAIRDSLWRWCRFCKLEITFEDRTGDAPPELIQDSPEPAHGELAVADVAGDHTIHVAFGVPPRAVLLRRGLVLAEGGVDALLPGLQPILGRSREHLQVWADSPALRTTMARDKVIAGTGLDQVEARVAAALGRLRERLCELVVASAAGEGPWDRQRHARYAFLHGHLERQREPLGERARTLPLLREVGGERALSADALAVALAGRPLLHAPPGPHAPATAELLRLARAIGYPVIAGDADDRSWLAGFAAAIGSPLVALDAGLGTVTAAPLDAPTERLRALVEAGLRRTGGGFAELSLAIGRYPESAPRPTLAARQLHRDGEVSLVLHGDAVPRRREAFTLWLDVDEALLRAASKAASESAATAALALALAIADLGDAPVDAEALLDAIESAGGPA